MCRMSGRWPINRGRSSKRRGFCAVFSVVGIPIMVDNDLLRFAGMDRRGVFRYNLALIFINKFTLLGGMNVWFLGQEERCE